MATLSQAKTLGGIGSILIFIPFVSLIGYILVVVAVKDVYDYLQDKAIFRNILIAALTGIVGAFVGGIAVIVGLRSGFTSGAFGVPGLAGVAAGLLVVWIFLIVSAIFLRRTYDTEAQRLWVGTFTKAAKPYLNGA